MGGRLSVLFLAAEAAPYIKVGGLADVAGSLPRALQNLPERPKIRLFLPLHGEMRLRDGESEPIDGLSIAGKTREWRVKLFRAVGGKFPVFFVGGDGIEPGSPVYHPDPAADGMKFALFSLAALEFCRRMGWQPDIVHANDWHAALAIYALKTIHGNDPFWAHTGSLLTIHNLPYQGQGAESALAEFGLPHGDDPRLPDWGRGIPLALGIAAADKVNTVSPSYAAEIQTPAFGAGLEGLLTARSPDIAGILNGIDADSWNPAQDTAITSRFDATHLRDRIKNKMSLQAELGFGTNSAIPLLAMVGRIDTQKGTDIVLEALLQCLDRAWRVVFLGTGDPRLEGSVRDFIGRHPDRARAFLHYDGSLARRIYAGADALLIPSRYEPCGLTQMLGMRYGCLPIARAVGGLKDTIEDGRTGFLTDGTTPEAFAACIHRALQVFHMRSSWSRMQKNAMRRDFSWSTQASKYYELYMQAHSAGTTVQPN